MPHTNVCTEIQKLGVIPAKRQHRSRPFGYISCRLSYFDRMSQRIFFTTLLWLVIVNLLIKAIFIFGIDLQVQHQVGQSAYGLYFTLLNLCYIFQIVNEFGLNLVHNTDTAFHGHVRKAHWHSILRLKLVLSIVYALVVFGVARLLGFTASWNILWWLILNNILISWITLLRAGISGMARYKMEAILSVMDKVLMILICGSMFFLFDVFQIEWFIWAQTISLVITLLMAVWISQRVSSGQRQEKGSPDTSVFFTFKSAVPFSVATLLMFVYTRSDSILIKKLLPEGDHEVGIFAAGFRLLDAANMIAFLFTPLLIPMYARLQANAKEVKELMRLAGGMMICMATCISFAGYWWARPIMQLCYGQADQQWVMTFSWLILAHIPVGLMYVYGSYLTAVRVLWKQNILYITSVALNILLNLYLIPRYGTIGAAFTAFVTQSLTTIGLILLVQRQLELAPNFSWLLKALLFVLFLFAGGWLLVSMPIHWMLGIGLFLTVGVGVAFLLRILDWEKMVGLIRKAEEV